jgi:hypothetical protein
VDVEGKRVELETRNVLQFKLLALERRAKLFSQSEAEQRVREPRDKYAVRRRNKFRKKFNEIPAVPSHNRANMKFISILLRLNVNMTTKREH